MNKENISEKKKEKLEHIAANRRTLMSYIPRRLKVEHCPELYEFPLNVLFGAAKKESDGSLTLAHGLYEPDLSTYTPVKGESGQSCAAMLYSNKYNREGHPASLILFRNFDAGLYVAIKNVGGTDVTEVRGDDWDTFFIELTSKGLYDGEPCTFKYNVLSENLHEQKTA